MVLIFLKYESFTNVFMNSVQKTEFYIIVQYKIGCFKTIASKSICYF